MMDTGLFKLVFCMRPVQSRRRDARPIDRQHLYNCPLRDRRGLPLNSVILSPILWVYIFNRQTGAAGWIDDNAIGTDETWLPGYIGFATSATNRWFNIIWRMLCCSYRNFRCGSAVRSMMSTLHCLRAMRGIFIADQPPSDASLLADGKNDENKRRESTTSG